MDAARYRKGIYQTLDAQNNVIADERWQWIATTDGGLRIDTETVWISPAMEPRGESISVELDAQYRLRRLSMYALRERRECQMRVHNGRIHTCWRMDEVSHNGDFSWADDCEIDYNSALFSAIARKRQVLSGSKSQAIRNLQLDALTFEPRWVRRICDYAGEALRQTRFGELLLKCFTVCDADSNTMLSESWCDADGVVYEHKAVTGGSFILVAVNLPGYSNT